MKYIGSLNDWFTDRPLVERVAAFVRLGIRHLEVRGWRGLAMADLHVECYRLGATLVATSDEGMGCLADPMDNDQGLRAWQESLELAESYGIKHLYVFSNQVDGQGQVRSLSAPYPEAKQRTNLYDQTAQLLKLVEQTDVQLWAKGLSRFNSGAAPLIHSAQTAAGWVKHFDHPQLRLAFDCYQQQRDSGNLIWNLVAHHGLYPVIHIADVPTGQEPGTGEINFPSLRTTLRELAFDGYVGLAFKPSTTEAEALARTRKIFPLE